MNIRNFPKKLDSKTSCLRIKVPENLDLALEGLIRKVLREQPETDDIYAFAANYFETLLSLRDKSGKTELNQKLSEKEANEMTILANSFPRPSRNRFSWSPVKTKEKRRKNSAGKLTKLNSSEEKENIKENVEPKASLSKSILGNSCKRKLRTNENENMPLKNFSGENIISSLAKTAALGTERVLSSMPANDNTQENNQSVTQNEAGAKSKEDNTFFNDNEESLLSEQINEIAKPELTSKVPEDIRTDGILSQQETAEGEAENGVKQVEGREKEAVDKSEVHKERDKLNEEIGREGINEDEKSKTMKNRTEEEAVEKETKNQNTSHEDGNEKIIKEDEKDAKEKTEKSDNETQIASTKENKDNENSNDDGKGSKLLKNAEEVNLQLKNDEENDGQITSSTTNLVQENISEISEKLDQGEGKEVVNNNESDNKMHDDCLNEKSTEAISKNESTEHKGVVAAEAAEPLKELENSANCETETLNDSMDFKKEGNENNDSVTNHINDLLESDKGEYDFQAKDKENKVDGKLETRDAMIKEENEADEKEKGEKIEETSLKPLGRSETPRKINAEADILREKPSSKDTAENSKDAENKEDEIKDEVQEPEKIKPESETTEGKEMDKENIETDNSKELDISCKSESKNSENDENRKEENKHQSLNNEKIGEEFVELPEAKENDSSSEEKSRNGDSVTDTTLDSQTLEPSVDEKKIKKDETGEDTKTKTSLDNKISIEQSEDDTIRLGESQLYNTENAKREDESGESQNVLANKIDNLMDTETSADSTCENKNQMNETGGTDTLEDKTNGSLPSNEIKNEVSIKDKQNDQNFEKNERGKEILEGTLNAKNADALNFVENSKSSFANNEQPEESQNEEDSTSLQEDSQISQTDAVKTEKNKLEEKKNSQEEKADKSEAIIDSDKVTETKISQIKIEKIRSTEDLQNGHETKIESRDTELMKSAQKEEKEISTADSQNKITERTTSDLIEAHKPKRSVTDTETIHENTEKPVEEISDCNIEINSLEKYKDEGKKEILSKNYNVPEEELCSVIDINEIRRVEETKETEEKISQKENAPEEELRIVVDSNIKRRVQKSDRVEKIEESHNLDEEELCSVVDAEEIRRVLGAGVKEDPPQGGNVPEEEMCSVVDINEIRKVQKTDVTDKDKKESLQDESSDVADKIQVITVEEKTGETEEASPQEENMPLKTIKTHYYDTLQVPEINIKEYRVKPLVEDLTFSSPRENRHSIIRAYQFEKETAGKELWTLIGNRGTSDNETENEFDYQRLEIDELMTPSSVTSMAVSEMSIFNETFLDSERLHSTFDKRYQLQGDTDTDPIQTEGDKKKEERKEIEEVIEKKTVGKSVAVPMTPRDSQETIEEENEDLENLKIPKEKPKGKRGLPLRERNCSSSNDRSIDSENFAFISVDIETMIGTQEIEEDENEEDESNKISGDVPFEVEIKTKVEVVSAEIDQNKERKTPEQESSDINWNAPSQSIKKTDGESFLDGNEISVETTETTSSSALTEIKRFDSTRKNLTRSSTQNLLTSQSLDKSMKIGVAEEFVKRKKLVKTKSLNSLREGDNDREIWRKIETELEEAATKIQSQFRSYRKKKKLQRGDAIQITSESSRSLTPVEPEIQHQLASGEFHDSIVLSIFPR